TTMFLLLLSLFFHVSSESSRVSKCNEVSFSSFTSNFGSIKRIERLSLSGTLSAFHVEFAMDDDTFQPLLQSNGLPLVSCPSM
ncbi:hypothetical protein PFISCL1PPCAC_15516, partial [Pristionchus fissidentatus]